MPASRKKAVKSGTRKVAAKRARAYSVRGSAIHGRGVFAARAIRKGAEIVEYKGQRISQEEADRRAAKASGDIYHTFLFQTQKGPIIDAGVRGNAARWINHSCAPNCEALEDDDGRVFIHAKRYIPLGTELGYDYRLTVGERLTKRLREAYACRCGAPRCRGTLLNIPRRKPAKPAR